MQLSQSLTGKRSNAEGYAFIIAEQCTENLAVRSAVQEEISSPMKTCNSTYEDST